MNQRNLKKIAIIGVPGSGKSSFAIKLGEILKIPVYHFDKHMFEENGKKKGRNEILSIEEGMVKEDSWIIEGCSLATLETRFSQADLVINFQMSRSLCIWRILKRTFVFDNALLETGCARIINWRLLKYIWTFQKEKGKVIDQLTIKYPDTPYIVFTTTQETDRYLGSLKNANIA